MHDGEKNGNLDNETMPPDPAATAILTPLAARPSGLLIVTIDRLPAWMLSAWGSTWVSTPAIDAMAGRGLLLDRLIATASDPCQTLASLFDSGSGKTLLASVASRDWQSAVVTDDLSTLKGLEKFGIQLGTDAKIDPIQAVTKQFVERDAGQTNIARLFGRAIEVLEAGAQRFVWCHATSLGVAWDAPHSFREAYADAEDPPAPPGPRVPNFRVDSATDPDLVVGCRQVFAGQLTLLDRQLGRLIHAATAAQNALGDGGWIVLVMGVRGLPLGLHGWLGCQDDFPPYSEVVQLPAILIDSSQRMVAQRYGGLVIPADVGATLRDLIDGVSGQAVDSAEQELAAPWCGRSFMRLLESWARQARDRVIVTGEGGTTIVTPDWQLVAPKVATNALETVQLFAKPDDFFELSDVANRCPVIADALRRTLQSAASGAPEAAWLEPLFAIADAVPG